MCFHHGKITTKNGIMQPFDHFMAFKGERATFFYIFAESNPQ
jgi:hypothetical protein